MPTRVLPSLGLFVPSALFCLFLAVAWPPQTQAAPTTRPTSATTTPSQKTSTATKAIEMPPLVITPKQEGERELLLWKVRGYHTHHFFLGSIHVVPKNFFPLHPKIQSAYRQSGTLVVEADIYNASTLGSAFAVVRYGTYCGINPFCRASLKDDLSPKVLSRLQKVLTRFGMNLGAMMRFKPWFVGLMLQGLHLKKAGISQSGVDHHFLRKATRQRRKIVQLESINEQLGLFNQLPMRLQKAFLEESFDASKFTKGIKKLLGLWKQGKTAKLEAYLEAEVQGSEDGRLMYERLLYMRNRNMARKIDKILKEQRTPHFIVVGAAHYVGKQNILLLLEQRGYQIIQIRGK